MISKKFKWVLAIAGVALFVAAISSSANAQFPSVKMPKIEKPTIEKPSVDTSGSTPTVNTDSTGTTNLGTGSSPIAGAGCKGTPHSSGNSPTLMFSTVLNGVKLNAREGYLKLDNIQAVFLPTPTCKSNSIYKYDPTNGGGLVWADLKDSSGKTVAKFEFTGEDVRDPYWNLSVARCAQCNKGNRMPMTPGSYTLEFNVEGNVFYRFPFSVSTAAPGSSFDGGNIYFLDGDWEKWAYIYYSNAEADKPLYWKVWLRNKGNTKDEVSSTVDVTVYRGGAPFAKSRGATYNLGPEWNRFELDLTEPMQGTSGGRYLKASDLLSTPGSYSLKMIVNGKPYGTWNFTVSGGKLNYAGRTAKQGLDRVEGGKDAWWYSKSGK